MKFQGQTLGYFNVEKFVSHIFSEQQHAKRIVSIANAALGVIASASLIVHRIGRGLAKVFNLSDKHAIKQVDRLLSNKKLNIEKLDIQWVKFLIGLRTEIKVTMDWTDFDKDNQATICLNLVTSHGRATPLLWKTIDKKMLKDHRNEYEDAILERLYHALPSGISVTILADRGFCDIRLMEFLKNDLKFNYCFRIRSNIRVMDAKGETRAASEWVEKNGKTKTLKNAVITSEKYSVGAFAIKYAPAMKEPWCIVCSLSNISGSVIIAWYAKRWGCEPQFRDTKDIHFGMGLYSTRISKPERRDRILFISAIATVLLTFLGAAGEAIGLDKYLKANTSKKRTLSLFRQGCILFDRLEKMVSKTACLLLKTFSKLIIDSQEMTEILGVV